MKHRVLLLAAIIAFSSPALSQSGPIGIGFAQAEEGTWWCRDGGPAKAFACAMAKCAKDSSGQECYPTRWCLPAGWSGTMIVWLPEFHSTVVLCGTSGERALVAGLKAFCDGSPFVTRCTPVTIIDPDGNERPIDGVDWPGPAIADTEAQDGDEKPDGQMPPG